MKKGIIFISSCFILGLCAGCSTTIQEVKFDVTFNNYDGTLLLNTKVVSGQDAVYTGETPLKEKDDGHSYVFSGRDKSLKNILKDTIFTAEFTSSINNYTVTWKNGDTILETDNDVPYGTDPTYDGATPTKEGDAENSYAFSGWSPEISTVTSNQTYIAQFTSSINNYTVTWKNGETVLETDLNVPYGTTPTYDGATPTKEGDAENSYAFSGWSPEISTVTSNQTYVAQFSAYSKSIKYAFDKKTNEYYVSSCDINAIGKIKIDSSFDDGVNGVRNVTSIGYSAFSKCTGLTSITIPDTVTSIGSRAFYECTSLTSITIPDGVTTIGDFALFYCISLEAINIPDGVTTIAAGAFAACFSLTSISVDPDNKTYCSINSLLIDIANNSIIACGAGLTSVTIPSNVTSIGNGAFFGCTGLTSITIPDNITLIGHKAFMACSKLASVNISNTVTSLGYCIFTGCESLTSIYIPESVSSIAGSLFENDDFNTNKLKSITVDPKNKYFYSTNNLLITTDNNEIIEFCGSCTSITIPDSVTSIGYSAFSWWTGLTSITIPDTVTSIGYSAFYRCTGLASITIPDGVTSIEDSTFSGCTGLTSITIPNSVTSIEDSAFYECTSLTSITIPDTVTSIGTGAFSGCTGLTSVIIPKNVTSIGECAFRECISLKSVTISGNTEFGLGVFEGCSNLSSAIFLNSVTKIGNNAFNGCTGLTSLIIPDSVTSIGNAFNGCTGLTSLIIPDSVTSIGNAFIGNAFNRCTGLLSIIIPNSILLNRQFHTCIFGGCPQLKCFLEITKEQYDEQLPDVNIGGTKYFYSETQPIVAGNYWHYVDGNPTIWEN